MRCRFRHQVHLSDRFLDTVLPDDPESRIPRCRSGFRTVVLRHGDDLDILPVTAPRDGIAYSPADLGDSFVEVRKPHNAVAYLKLHRGSRESA